jgi:hypothetical protein
MNIASAAAGSQAGQPVLLFEVAGISARRFPGFRRLQQIGEVNSSLIQRTTAKVK